jgi:predicted Zn-dependent protease
MFTKTLRSVYVLAFLLVLSIVAVDTASAKTSLKDEIEIGQKAAKEIEKEYPVTDNKEWLKEIDKLGRSLIPYVKRKDIPYTFKIIKERDGGKDELDAFSLPGGPVYFSERMWRLMTRQERIGILAHEIAHIDKRHAIDTISENQRRSMWAAAVLILSGAGNGVWNAADLANSLYTLKFSRKREREADMMGIDLCIAARESPAGLVTALDKLRRIEKEEGSRPLKILSSHPATEDRVKYLTERCLQLGFKQDDLRPRYKDQPDRIGDVVERGKEESIITVSTIRKLSPNETVWIKKPLWDDATNTVIPKLVAKGTVINGGNRAQVSIKMEPGFEYIDVEPGDGVYPRQIDSVPPPPEKKKSSNRYYLGRQTVQGGQSSNK